MGICQAAVSSEAEDDGEVAADQRPAHHRRRSAPLAAKHPDPGLDLGDEVAGKGGEEPLDVGLFSVDGGGRVGDEQALGAQELGDALAGVGRTQSGDCLG